MVLRRYVYILCYYMYGTCAAKRTRALRISKTVGAVTICGFSRVLGDRFESTISYYHDILYQYSYDGHTRVAQT